MGNDLFHWRKGPQHGAPLFVEQIMTTRHTCTPSENVVLITTHHTCIYSNNVVLISTLNASVG